MWGIQFPSEEGAIHLVSTTIVLVVFQVSLVVPNLSIRQMVYFNKFRFYHFRRRIDCAEPRSALDESCGTYGVP